MCLQRSGQVSRSRLQRDRKYPKAKKRLTLIVGIYFCHIIYKLDQVLRLLFDFRFTFYFLRSYTEVFQSRWYLGDVFRQQNQKLSSNVS